MKSIAVIYHSAHGHTGFIAGKAAEGARLVPGSNVKMLTASEISSTPDALTRFDGLTFGSPTYLGGVSGTFKSFMDATDGLWKRQSLRGKLAAGFTVSSLPAGDKQSTLLSMAVFAMQHGVLWIGNPILPEQHSGVPYEQAANRLGSWTGLMAQAGHGAPADEFASGDVRGAQLFGKAFAGALARISPCALEAVL